MPALGWAGTRPMPAENLDIVRRGYDGSGSSHRNCARPATWCSRTCWSGHAGIEVTQRFVHVWTMRHRRACRMRAYLDKREAMRAAGIAVD
jgi:hypothetical protein